MFSSRIPWTLEPNRLSRILARKEAVGETILRLTESNPTRCELPYERETILRALASPEALRYEPHPKGLLPAREVIARYYADLGAAISPDQIFLTASTSEAYSFLFKLLADWGDSLLVPAPSYPLLEYLAALDGVQRVPYRLEYAHPTGWGIDLESVKAAIRPDTRAILLIHPNNPTGSYVRRQEAEVLFELCRQRSMALIVDEVFRDYALAPRPEAVRTFAGEDGALTFVLSGFSKMLGLPQLKLGWIVLGGPRGLRERASSRLELIADTFLSVSAPVQLAAPALLEQREPFQRYVRQRLSHNLAILERATENTPVRLRTCEGGWCAVLEVPRFESEESLVCGLLEEENVLVHPGYFYDFAYEGIFVLSLLIPPTWMHAGIRRIMGYFNRLMGLETSTQ